MFFYLNFSFKIGSKKYFKNKINVFLTSNNTTFFMYCKGKWVIIIIQKSKINLKAILSRYFNRGMHFKRWLVFYPFKNYFLEKNYKLYSAPSYFKCVLCPTLRSIEAGLCKCFLRTFFLTQKEFSDINNKHIVKPTAYDTCLYFIPKNKNIFLRLLLLL